jgi:peroxiredoxin
MLFFPLAFTSVCTTELCSMRDNMTDYAELDAEVVAISVDSLFTLDKFKKAENLSFPYSQILIKKYLLLTGSVRKLCTGYERCIQTFGFCD